MTRDPIDDLAIAMCEELGVSAYETEVLPHGARMTPAEQANADIDQMSKEFPLQRWETFRPAAAMYIAADRAKKRLRHANGRAA